jgi:hypothetical protein
MLSSILVGCILILQASRLDKLERLPGGDWATPCTWEDPANASVQKTLAIRWRVAQRIAHKKADAPRPRVCFRQSAPVAVMDTGRVGFLCGYYEPSNNTVLVAVNDKICPVARCGMIHEFLHAILGVGHEHYKEMMAQVDCQDAE